MEQVKLMRIKSIYGELKGAFEQLPSSEKQYHCNSELVVNYNNAVEELMSITNLNYSRQIINENDVYRDGGSGVRYLMTNVRAKFGAIINRLEEEYDFGRRIQNVKPAIVINNQNSSNIDIKLNFTIENLINNTDSKEEKENLQVISEEINSGNANWERLKSALSWIINYSKDLSMKVIPIVLDYYLKKGN